MLWYFHAHTILESISIRRVCATTNDCRWNQKHLCIIWMGTIPTWITRCSLYPTLRIFAWYAVLEGSLVHWTNSALDCVDVDFRLVEQGHLSPKTRVTRIEISPLFAWWKATSTLYLRPHTYKQRHDPSILSRGVCQPSRLQNTLIHQGPPELHVSDRTHTHCNTWLRTQGATANLPRRNRLLISFHPRDMMVYISHCYVLRHRLMVLLHARWNIPRPSPNMRMYSYRTHIARWRRITSAHFDTCIVCAYCVVSAAVLDLETRMNILCIEWVWAPIRIESR